MEPLSQRLRHQLVRFLAVGAVGFSVDIGVLGFLLYGLGYVSDRRALVWCRVASFFAAIGVTYLLNARFTFAAPIRGAGLSRYVLIQLLGALLNLGTYTFLVLGPLERPLIALAVGSAVATVSNFVLVRRYVYAWR